jgi:hypothetical protein
MALDDDITRFAQTNYRRVRRFGIPRRDRRHHMYLIGKTGTGKSTLLHTLIVQDIHNGEGLALLDPHGDLAERIIAEVPADRQADLIYFNVPDPEHPISFNPLENVPPAKRSLVAAGLLEVFQKIFHDSWGVRMEHILRNTLLALLDQPEATLADILRMFEDATFLFTSTGFRAGNSTKYPTTGAFAGAGLGLFVTNAGNSTALGGPFDTVLASLGPLGLEYDHSGPTKVLSITIGKSMGLGVARLQTNTGWTACK